MEVRDVFTDLQPSHLSAFESLAIHWLPWYVLFVTKDRQTPGTDRHTPYLHQQGQNAEP